VQLDHEFTIPVPPEQAWPVLLDVERIAPCMPGATVTKVDGEEVEGTVKVKVGPITVAYGGTATFLETDEVARRVVIEARGKETRGSGTASARVTAQMRAEGEGTRVTVSTDLSITGKPAQFGRGVMADVGGRILGQFAECLSRKLAQTQEPAQTEEPGEPAEEPAAAAEPAGGPLLADAPHPNGSPATTATTATTATRAPVRTTATAPAQRETDDAIDLLGAAGVPVLKRAAPVLGGIVLLVLFVVLRRRR
jgi:uncharacterized protein